MIIVSKSSKPFQYTAKNTARRHVTINDYEKEINHLYATVDESTQSSIPPPKEWDIVSTTDFVRTVVNKVLVSTIQDNDDVFEHGCDRYVRKANLCIPHADDSVPAYKQRGFEIQSSEHFESQHNLIRETLSTILSTITHQFYVWLTTLWTWYRVRMS